MKRIIIFFLLVIPSGGFSALQWLWRYTFHQRTMNLQDLGRVRYAFGINSPAPTVVAAWARYEADRSYENRKNVEAEWAKPDAHRAAFFLSLIILSLALIVLLQAIALTLVLVFL